MYMVHICTCPSVCKKPFIFTHSLSGEGFWGLLGGSEEEEVVGVNPCFDPKTRKILSFLPTGAAPIFFSDDDGLILWSCTKRGDGCVCFHLLGARRREGMKERARLFKTSVNLGLISSRLQ